MIFTTLALLDAALQAGRDAADWLRSALQFLAYPTGPVGEWIIAYGDVAVLVAGIGVAIFAASYGGFFNWRKTQAGRALFQFTLALTAVLVLVILARLVSQEYPFRWLARDVIYTWLAISSIRLVTELWRNWRRGGSRLLDIDPKPRKKDHTMADHAKTTALATLASNLTASRWWKAASIRGLRTAIVLALPYIGAATLFGDVPWVAIASTAALGFVLSLFTSLAGLTEAGNGTVPLWLALLERVTKTGAQSIVAGIGTAVLLQDVDWALVLQAAAFASLGSLLLGVLTALPEAAPVIDGRETNVITSLNGPITITGPATVSSNNVSVQPDVEVVDGPVRFDPDFGRNEPL